ncbi:protein kinase domain-containing protein [Actinomadura scrupuli]|uniref:serine/threonine-protein kinase n=1 Tax=Actinomadura scrupuli TaxID=559629 RepID=UPI003D980037
MGRLLAGRYRLLAQVGRGGMGSVWHARDEVLDRDVAVKEVLVHPGLGDAEREVLQERTKREARATARLSHPGVVTVYDVVEEDGRPWIIMELVRARSLDRVIKKDGPLPWRRAAEVGRQVLGALHAAHEAGILHRDVKPSNVLLAAGDRAVLTDFGIATSAGDATLTSTGLLMGSPSYVAPERARGRPAGPASDLWSLGVTFYAMVDGKSPFERSEPMASLVAIISDDPAWTAAAGPLWPVIEGLLDKDPDRRLTAYQAGQMLDGLLLGDLDQPDATRPVPLPAQSPAAGDPPAAGEPPAAEDLPAAGGPSADPAVPVASHVPAPASRPAAVQPGPDDATKSSDAVMAYDLGEPTVGSRERAARRPVLWAAAALVGVLALGGVALALTSNDGGGKPSSAPRSATTSAAGSPKASASTLAKTSPPATSAAVPAGFKSHKDSSGYSVLVPKGWSGPERKSGGDFFYSPDRSSYLQIDQTSDPNPSALKDWKDQESSVAGRFAGYKRIRLGPATEGGPIADPTGAKAADWEYTWQSGPGRKHVLSRGLVMNGHGYAIVIAAPDDEWDKTRAQLAPVFADFRPASTS